MSKKKKIKVVSHEYDAEPFLSAIDISHWQGDDMWTARYDYPPQETRLPKVTPKEPDGLIGKMFWAAIECKVPDQHFFDDIRRMCYSLADTKPDQIIFNGVTTICIFPGGEKIISRPSNDDDFDPEFGVMSCIVKRIYGSRNQFKKAVAEGYRQDE